MISIPKSDKKCHPFFGTFCDYIYRSPTRHVKVIYTASRCPSKHTVARQASVPTSHLCPSTERLPDSSTQTAKDSSTQTAIDQSTVWNSLSSRLPKPLCIKYLRKRCLRKRCYANYGHLCLGTLLAWMGHWHDNCRGEYAYAISMPVYNSLTWHDSCRRELFYTSARSLHMAR